MIHSDICRDGWRRHFFGLQDGQRARERFTSTDAGLGGSPRHYCDVGPVIHLYMALLAGARVEGEVLVRARDLRRLHPSDVAIGHSDDTSGAQTRQASSLAPGSDGQRHVFHKGGPPTLVLWNLCGDPALHAKVLGRCLSCRAHGDDAFSPVPGDLVGGPVEPRAAFLFDLIEPEACSVGPENRVNR